MQSSVFPLFLAVHFGATLMSKLKKVYSYPKFYKSVVLNVCLTKLEVKIRLPPKIQEKGKLSHL